MSAVLKVAVADGVVMATDSRITIAEGEQKRTFDGFQKLFVFRPDVPIAMMTWGQNRIKEFSIADLLANVDQKMRDEDPEWKLDKNNVTVAGLAERVTNIVFHDYYQPATEEGIRLGAMSLHFAGFSAAQSRPEHVEYRLTPEHIDGPHAAANQSVQVNFDAPYISRMMTGMASELMGTLKEAGLDEEESRNTLMKFGSSQLRQLVSPGMPLEEVAALAKCMMDTEINLNRFGYDPDVIGGDIQMVVIDRNGCRQMRFRPTDHRIPRSVWKQGNLRHKRPSRSSVNGGGKD